MLLSFCFISSAWKGLETFCFIHFLTPTSRCLCIFLGPDPMLESSFRPRLDVRLRFNFILILKHSSVVIVSYSYPRPLLIFDSGHTFMIPGWLLETLLLILISLAGTPFPHLTPFQGKVTEHHSPVLEWQINFSPAAWLRLKLHLSSYWLRLTQKYLIGPFYLYPKETSQRSKWLLCL